MEDERLAHARVNMWLAVMVAGSVAGIFITFCLIAGQAKAF